MTDKDARIFDLTKEIGTLRNALYEAIKEICFNCEEYSEKNPERCKKCRWRKYTTNEPT